MAELSLAEAMGRVNAAIERGDLDRAAGLLVAIIEQQPGYAPAAHCLGKIGLVQGRTGESVEWLETACELDGARSEYWDCLGQAHLKAGAIQPAVKALERALQLGPEPAAAVHLLRRLAKAHGSLGHLGRARELLRQALALAPDEPGSLYELSVLLLSQGEYAQAEAGLRRVLEHHPGEVALYRQIAQACQHQGKLPAGVRVLEAALARWPGDPVLANHLGALFCEFHQYRDGVPWLEKAWRGAPDNVSCLTNLIKACGDVCDWGRVESLRPELLEAVQRGAAVAPFELILLGCDDRTLTSAGARWSRGLPRSATPLFDANSRRGQGRDRKIRIGYASCDFCEHATARLMVRLFALHDRKRFEVIAYDWSPDDGGTYRDRIRADCDRFVAIGQLGDRDAAAQIAGDSIDILVDLKGYTREARPGIFAMRPAPVQVHYLGYPASTGADFIDYFVADRVVIPPADRSAFSECVVTLPCCYQINDDAPLARTSPGRAELGLPVGAFVFCCFNAHNKIGQQESETWMRLLHNLPGSVLWLYDKFPEARLNLTAAARVLGMDPARLHFAQHAPQLEHQARLASADLFLDSFRYGAHTTASDALAAGVPVITCEGRNFASRVAASLLTTLGLLELIAPDVAAYEQIALSLARHPEKLAALRSRLAAASDESPLFRPGAFVPHLESAYERMWQRWMDGLGPAPIEVG